jgi:hypothetical protein
MITVSIFLLLVTKIVYIWIFSCSINRRVPLHTFISSISTLSSALGCNLSFGMVVGGGTTTSAVVGKVSRHGSAKIWPLMMAVLGLDAAAT